MTSDTRREFRRHETDIQAIVGTGLPQLRACTYLLLRVIDKEQARRWVAACTPMVRSIAQVRPDEGPGAGPETAGTESCVTLAFTFAGLQALGFEESADFPFPSAFKAGMADPVRAPMFGDDPGGWDWGRCADTAPHVLAVVYWRAGGARPRLPAWVGLQEVHRISGCPSYIDPHGAAVYEPFGFRDGIGQPVIRGLRESRQSRADRNAAGYADRLVAPGEFLLGHANEYGEIAQCPDFRDPAPGVAGTTRQRIGFNGSFLVMRQYAQDVDAFNQFDQPVPVACPAHNPASPGALQAPAKAITYAEKMIGRTREGDPLVPRQSGASDHTTDAFRYRNEDAVGFLCPRGAHSRRAGPRDTLGSDVETGVAASKLHRILRRGRAWTTHCQRDADHACGDARFRCARSDRRCGKGIVFIALNADLERQYEFIQQHWIMNPRFAGLVGESDPILGPAGTFGIPAPSGGVRVEHTALTRVLGGAYFFLPGLAALRRIAAGPGA
jgi:putative iron-dependent peroxidase